MISIDTNLLIYARVSSAPQHSRAAEFLHDMFQRRDVIMAELVLVELYLALRNPAILQPTLSPAAAVAECQLFRRHPHWALIENADVMTAVWERAGRRGFARRRIIDLRLAKTLQAHGVTEFATANVKDFKGVGIDRVWNPLAA